MHGIAVRLVRALTLPLGRLSERLGNRFFLVLAVLLIAVSAYALLAGKTGGLKHGAYDLILKNRFQVPAADSDIVVVDIDEASLAAMAPQYGRWPWPRSVMGELLEGIRAQGPRAVVFDITFSDPDVFQPQADRYFREAVAATPQSFFPMIRLNPENDRLSEIRLAELPGVLPAEANPPQDATVAVVVPYFLDALGDRRLGTNNLYADADGIARAYHIYRDVAGWRIYSLPANVVAATGSAVPERPQVLLNWRGRPPAYHTIPFHALYADLLKERRERARDEFAGKIVVIGSTAPSLFDIRPTPVSQSHPGVEVLATAIDNLKNGDYLTELPRSVALAVTVVAILLLAAAFTYNTDYITVRFAFTLVQSALLAVTYLFLNYTTVFVDLTAPFTAGLAYFFVARTYGVALSLRRNGNPLFSTALDPGRECQVLLLAVHLGAGREQRRAHAEIERQVGLTRFGASAPRLFGSAPLLHEVYRDTAVVYWLSSPGQTRAALRDVEGLIARLRARGARLPDEARFALHAARFVVDSAGAWREPGKAALREALSLASPRSAPNLVITPAFESLCREQGIAPPTALETPTERAAVTV